jgi:hypothetical protein
MKMVVLSSAAVSCAITAQLQERSGWIIADDTPIIRAET